MLCSTSVYRKESEMAIENSKKKIAKFNIEISVPYESYEDTYSDFSDDETEEQMKIFIEETLENKLSFISWYDPAECVSRQTNVRVWRIHN